MALWFKGKVFHHTPSIHRGGSQGPVVLMESQIAVLINARTGFDEVCTYIDQHVCLLHTPWSSATDCVLLGTRFEQASTQRDIDLLSQRPNPGRRPTQGGVQGNQAWRDENRLTCALEIGAPVRCNAREDAAGSAALERAGDAQRQPETNQNAPCVGQFRGSSPIFEKGMEMTYVC